MDEVKEKISTLSNEEKEELFEYLKRMINNEFKFEETEIHSCHKCNSTSIVKLRKYNNMQRYKCKNCGTTFTSKSKSNFAATKLDKDKWLKYAECLLTAVH